MVTVMEISNCPDMKKAKRIFTKSIIINNKKTKEKFFLTYRNFQIKELLSGIVLSTDEEVREHVDAINSVIKKVKLLLFFKKA